MTAHLRRLSLTSSIYSPSIDTEPLKEQSLLWKCFAHTVTCWTPGALLTCCCGLRTKEMRMAFREKIALCVIIGLMCALLGFLTLAMGRLLCPLGAYGTRLPWQELVEQVYDSNGPQWTWAFGNVYEANEMAAALNVSVSRVLARDIGNEFGLVVSENCLDDISAAVLASNCSERGTCWDPQVLLQVPRRHTITFEWEDLQDTNDLIVVDGYVIKAPTSEANPFFVDPQLEEALEIKSNRDLSHMLRLMGSRGEVLATCMIRYFMTARISKMTIGCFAYNFFQILSFVAISLVILVRFALAVGFSWFLSRKLDHMENQKKSLRDQQRSLSIPSMHPEETIANPCSSTMMTSMAKALRLSQSSMINLYGSSTNMGRGSSSTEPFVFLLVTCYSEDESGLRMTLDSLAETDYHDERKLLFIVSDGQVYGAGSDQSTPSIIANMMTVHYELRNPEPKAYNSIGHETWQQFNMAKVHAGHYIHRGRRVPCVLVEKCGSMDEQRRHELTKNSGGCKAGNRGKRDSQLILMGLMQRVLLNDRLTALDYDLFNKIVFLTAVSPDVFEMVLMVDADTKVASDALSRMVNAMRRDPSVMGLCGETKIANRTSSWVTMIQVFEYHISHHLGKAFESVFGGVTCLPGCFCMYRLHGPTIGGRRSSNHAETSAGISFADFRLHSSAMEFMNQDSDVDGLMQRRCQIVPILANPMVVSEYSQSTATTLHEKNLLLLGEDRFLTTVLLKTFPMRKMIFVPKAQCYTMVPEEFKVLLSQRRRWINSTIHNLLELVRVPSLCGVFCCSMQFVVAMELIGTVVLPAAIVFTGILVISAVFDFYAALIPMVLLAMVLGLPAVLIVITSRNLVYILWMLVYLLALPVWNFVLPMYAYWHFDDFSWGQTRKTADVRGNENSASGQGSEDPSSVSVERLEAESKTWLAWTCDL